MALSPGFMSVKTTPPIGSHARSEIMGAAVDKFRMIGVREVFDLHLPVPGCNGVSAIRGGIPTRSASS